MDSTESKRNGSSIPVEAIILFDGVHSLWKCGRSIDVIIIAHRYCNCIEIAAKDVELKTIFPRLYLDHDLCYSKLKSDDVEKELKKRVEPFLRKHQTCNMEEFDREVRYDLIHQYILCRLAISDDQKLTLRANFCDVVNKITDELDVVTQKPTNIQVFSIQRWEMPDNLWKKTNDLTKYLEQVTSDVDTYCEQALKYESNIAKNVPALISIRTSVQYTYDDIGILENTNSKRDLLRNNTFKNKLPFLDMDTKPPDSPSKPKTKTPKTPRVTTSDILSQLESKLPSLVHKEHIPGMKLLKKVGSFKHCNDSEYDYAGEMRSKRLSMQSKEPFLDSSVIAETHESRKSFLLEGNKDIYQLKPRTAVTAQNILQKSNRYDQGNRKPGISDHSAERSYNIRNHDSLDKHMPNVKFSKSTDDDETLYSKDSFQKSSSLPGLKNLPRKVQTSHGNTGRDRSKSDADTPTSNFKYDKSHIRSGLPRFAQATSNSRVREETVEGKSFY